MITTHPQRWTDKPVPWLKELVLQNVKNVVKRLRKLGIRKVELGMWNEELEVRCQKKLLTPN